MKYGFLIFDSIFEDHLVNDEFKKSIWNFILGARDRAILAGMEKTRLKLRISLADQSTLPTGQCPAPDEKIDGII